MTNPTPTDPKPAATTATDPAATHPATEADATAADRAAAGSAAADPAAARTAEARKADVLAKLTAPVADAWVATAAADTPYLVPLTLAWLRDRIVLATDSTSRTATNIAVTGTARLSLGATRDVVMIDAVRETTFPVHAAPDWVADGYAEKTDWDPRETGDTYIYLLLRPDRIQAWREANEIKGRTLMRTGTWLV